ncbi:MAG: Lipid A biosynthesis lauroyltransferase [Chlamydiae bacterium]|nr:Lipid A biosynthesis lauroyltransferase [Chlamydiota bacterium]
MSNKTPFKHKFAYYSLRAFFLSLSFLPYSWIHKLGWVLGSLTYFLAPKKLKKITYNNLALAKRLNLSEKQIKKIARESFQNLVITGLEYFRLKSSRKKFNRFVTGHNLGPCQELLDSGQGIILVTGHISNWEVGFLHFTQTHTAYAIGKPIKNLRLYDYIKSIREMHGGTIIEMSKAISKGIEVLKKGQIFSMLNDQSFTSSSYSFPFFGARAWTSSSPALLSYRSRSPIIFATTTRLKGGRYEYTMSDPIFPNRNNPIKKEVPRLMDEVMKGLEAHITKHPGQWLWQHKRWKQEGFHRVYPEYKADSILFILPQNKQLFDQVQQGMKVLPQIYRRSFLTFMVPKKYRDTFDIGEKYECLYYSDETDLLVRDYRFQLIFDFERNPKIRKHFLKLGGHRSFNLDDLVSKLPEDEKKPLDIRHLFIRVLCLPDTPFQS